jgi:hypothetical protein
MKQQLKSDVKFYKVFYFYYKTKIIYFTHNYFFPTISRKTFFKLLKLNLLTNLW